MPNPRRIELRSEGASFRTQLADLAIPSSLFSFVHDSKRFLADLSEVQVQLHRVNSNLYDDALDVGFVMRSTKTGALVVFALEREEVKEGDLLAYHYKITPASAARVPALEGATVTMFND